MIPGVSNLSERLRSLRLERGLSQLELAELAGLSRNTISGWELGKHGYTRDKLEAVADALGVQVFELLLNTAGGDIVEDDTDAISRVKDAGAQPTNHRAAVPFYSAIPSGGWNQVAPEYADVLEIDRKLVTNDQMVVIQVNDSSMAPEFQCGDRLLIDTRDTKPRSLRYIAVLYRGEPLLRRYQKIDHRRFLAAVNPHYPTIEIESPDDVVVLGVVQRLIDRDYSKPQL